MKSHASSVGIFGLIGQAFEADSPVAKQTLDHLQTRLSPESLQQLQKLHEESPDAFSIIDKALGTDQEEPQQPQEFRRALRGEGG